MAPALGCSQHLPGLWRVNTVLRHDLAFHCWSLYKVAKPWGKHKLVVWTNMIHYFPVFTKERASLRVLLMLQQKVLSLLNLDPWRQIKKKFFVDEWETCIRCFCCLTNLEDHPKKERLRQSLHISNWHNDAGLCSAFLGQRHLGCGYRSI